MEGQGICPRHQPHVQRDRHRAEPFIAHFLWEYSCHFPDREGTFESVTARAPYYMALNLLRIARNGYISPDYGARLVSEAELQISDDHDGIIELSKQTLGGEHPAVWSIDPAAAKDALMRLDRRLCLGRPAGRRPVRHAGPPGGRRRAHAPAGRVGAAARQAAYPGLRPQ